MRQADRGEGRREDGLTSEEREELLYPGTPQGGPESLAAGTAPEPARHSTSGTEIAPNLYLQGFA